MLIRISIVISFISLYESARILAVFPSPSISHQVAFRPFTQELAKRGHEVVVITTDPVFPYKNGPSNLTEIDVHDISYEVAKNIVKMISTASTDNRDIVTQVMFMLQSTLECVIKYPHVKEINNLLKTKQFDLLIIEAFVRPALVFSYFYKVPVILISSFGGVFNNYHVVGAPTHPILYPTVFHQKVNNLSIMDKIVELYHHYKIDALVQKQEYYENAMLKKHFGEHIPTLGELSNNVDLMFLNIHPLFEGIRPVPPNVIYLRGMHAQPEKELDAELQQYLNSSTNGVIYFSFGTNILPSALPDEKKQIIVKALSSLPFNVLLKYDKDELQGKADNIMIRKWFPQSDLLKHPNIKAFITQGGLQSTDEAITAGVPLIAIPMLGDQWFNAEKYEYHQIGVKLEFETLNIHDLRSTIKMVIENKSYRQNIISLRELMQDEPMKPIDRAIWWTEYVLRHGGAKHLRSPAANITWTQYLELELLGTLLVGLLISFVLLIITLYYLYKYSGRIFTQFNNNSKEKKM